MQELTFEQAEIASGAGWRETACVSGFTALGTLGGFIIGSGIASMGAVACWGLRLAIYSAQLFATHISEIQGD